MFQLAKYVRSFKDEISKLLPTEASTCDVEKKAVSNWTDKAEMSLEELVLKKRKAKGRQGKGLIPCHRSTDAMPDSAKRMRGAGDGLKNDVDFDCESLMAS